MSPLASRLGRVVLAAVVLGSVTTATVAPAQPKSPTDEARELAREGWDALDAQDYRAALDKVTKAEALYHAPTHLLLMGNALMGLGKLADALATFERLAAEPLPAASPPAFKDAQETGRKRMKELLARVPSLLVVVESSDAPGATVTVDGQKVDFASGVAVRFDPGTRVIGVEAEGFAPAKKTVVLPERGGVVRVPIALERPRAAGAGSADASASGAASAGPAGGAPKWRVPAYVSFGVAGASLLGGAISGAVSIAQTSDLKGRCPENLCPEGERGALDGAHAAANASTALFVIGGVAAAAGVVLMVIDLGPGPGNAAAAKGARAGARPALRAEPWVSFGGAGVRGTF